jgi:hypothetical protein
MILASTVPLWIDIWDHFFIPTLMAGSLVAWILTRRRWVCYAYWVIVALGLMGLAFQVAHEGWEAFLFQDRWSKTYSGTRLEEGKTVCYHSSVVWFFNPRERDQLDFAAKLTDWTIVLLSLSAPFWRKWLRRKLGLRDN